MVAVSVFYIYGQPQTTFTPVLQHRCTSPGPLVRNSLIIAVVSGHGIRCLCKTGPMPF